MRIIKKLILLLVNFYLRISRRVLQRFGFYIDGITLKYLPNEEYIHRYLNTKPLQVQFFELNRLCSIINLNNDHYLYDKILRTYIPNYELKLTDKKFIGKGGGHNSLSCYRKVKEANKDLFEKIYFTKSLDLEKCLWMYGHVYDLIKDEIRAPKLHYQFSGSFFTILYYEFLKPEHAKNTNIHDKIIAFSKSLYQLSLTKKSLNIIESAPNFITNFKTHYHYKKNIIRAKQELLYEGIEIEEIESIIKTGRFIFTHGDIKDENMSLPNILFDWDSFGIYPAGLEQAYIYFNLIRRKESVEPPLEYLKKHYHESIKAIEWDVFQLTFVYFLLVFSTTIFSSQKYDGLKKSIINNLKMLIRYK